MVELHCHLDGSIRDSVLTKFLGHRPKDILFYKGMGIEKALESFKTTLGTLQTSDLVNQAVYNLCLDLNMGGVYGGEIRFAPQLHYGNPVEEIVEAAVSGIWGNINIILWRQFEFFFAN